MCRSTSIRQPPSGLLFSQLKGSKHGYNNTSTRNNSSNNALELFQTYGGGSLLGDQQQLQRLHQTPVVGKSRTSLFCPEEVDHHVMRRNSFNHHNNNNDFDCALERVDCSYNLDSFDVSPIRCTSNRKEVISVERNSSRTIQRQQEFIAVAAIDDDAASTSSNADWMQLSSLTEDDLNELAIPKFEVGTNKDDIDDEEEETLAWLERSVSCASFTSCTDEVIGWSSSNMNGYEGDQTHPQDGTAKPPSFSTSFQHYDSSAFLPPPMSCNTACTVSETQDTESFPIVSESETSSSSSSSSSSISSTETVCCDDVNNSTLHSFTLNDASMDIITSSTVPQTVETDQSMVNDDDNVSVIDLTGGNHTSHYRNHHQIRHQRHPASAHSTYTKPRVGGGSGMVTSLPSSSTHGKKPLRGRISRDVANLMKVAIRHQTFLKFVKTLLQQIEKDGQDELLKIAKNTIKECTYRNRIGDPCYRPLKEVLVIRLRSAGKNCECEKYWNRTRSILGYDCYDDVKLNNV